MRVVASEHPLPRLRSPGWEMNALVESMPQPSMREENEALKRRVLELEQQMWELRRKVVVATGPGPDPQRPAKRSRQLAFSGAVACDDTQATAIQRAVDDVTSDFREQQGYTAQLQAMTLSAGDTFVAAESPAADGAAPWLPLWHEWRDAQDMLQTPPPVAETPYARLSAVDARAMHFDEWRRLDLDMTQPLDCRCEPYIRHKFRQSQGWVYETSLMTVMPVPRREMKILQLRVREKFYAREVAEAIAERDHALELIGARIESEVRDGQVWWTLRRL